MDLAMSSCRKMPLTRTITEAMLQDPDHVALISALEKGEFDVANEILARDSQNKYIYPMGPLKVTALHVAAWQGRIDLLEQLYAKGADVSASDKIGRCALYYAAHCGHTDVTRWILEHGGDIHAKVGVNLCTKKNINDSTFMKDYNYLVGQVLPLPMCWGRTPLHQAVKNNHADVVRLLVEAGADVNAKDEGAVSPLLLAGSALNREDAQEMANFVEIIKILVSKKAFVNIIHPDTGTTALHHAAVLGNAEAIVLLLEEGAWPMFKCKSSGSTPLHIAASIGNVEALLALLKVIQPPYVSVHRIDTCDHLNRTALHLAAYQGHRDCVRVLIKQGGNLAAMTKTGVTVIDAIFAHIPRPLAFLTDILDSCVRTINNCSSEKCDTITVDFTILAPKYQMQMAIITSIITTISNMTQLAILKHPLVETFLRLKWSKLKKYFFILVLVHIVFVISLSNYALAGENKANSDLIHAICAFLLFVNNMFQVILEPRHFLKQYETWLSYICVTLSFVIAIMSKVGCFKNCTKVNGKVPDYKNCQWEAHFLSATLLLAWIQMMWLIGRFPMWGYYALMFSSVLKNMLKVFLAFGYLIIGFALSFTVLLPAYNPTNSTNIPIWTSIVKTEVMMMGEFNYDTLLNDSVPVTSSIVFFLFTLLVSIVLINLMIGLAVSDIQTIEKEGHIRQLLKQAEFIAYLERVTSHRFFRRNWLWRRFSIHSNCDIPRNITLSYRENYSHKMSHVEAPRDIPSELKEVLFFLAIKSCCMDDSTGDRIAEDVDTKLNSLLSNLEEHLQKWKSLRHTNSVCQKISKRRGIKKKCKPRNNMNF